MDLMPSDQAAPPQRMLTRLVADFGIEVICAWMSALGDLKPVVVFQGVHLANTEFLLADDAAAAAHAAEGPPDALRRPIRVHALAHSLGLSPETTRRMVNRLEADGYCERRPNGVIAPAEVMRRPVVTAAEDATLASFLRLLKDMHQLGWRPPPVAALDQDDLSLEALAPVRRLLLLNIQDYAYRSVLECVPVHGNDYLRGLIFVAIMSENTQGVTYDPTLAWTFASAGSPPPDELREPVSIRSVAGRLGLPPETVRRYINQLLRLGHCQRGPEGIVIPTEFMMRPDLMRCGLNTYMWFLNMMRRMDRQLAECGFDLRRPAVADSL